MLESQMKQIKNYLGSFLNFFGEDKELQKREYFDKLEQTLELTIKIFKKYNVSNSFGISFCNHENYSTNEMYLFLLFNNDEAKWQIIEENKPKSFEESITTNELVTYCWENKVELKRLINSLFDYISQLFAKKEQVIKKEKDKYISEMACLNEAIKNLQELADTDISEDIKNK
ncbi:hypothetical protein ACN4EE_06505 [Geminocystis sp. CENA526]|uniref:hypothetical protein n=1 Tax=Geminocystis sp. CENA526 TaxID=1355871 RepID=UPI003D6EB6E1